MRPEATYSAVKAPERVTLHPCVAAGRILTPLGRVDVDPASRWFRHDVGILGGANLIEIMKLREQGVGPHREHHQAVQIGLVHRQAMNWGDREGLELATANWVASTNRDRMHEESGGYSPFEVNATYVRLRKLLRQTAQVLSP